jgi:hypothetical protein
LTSYGSINHFHRIGDKRKTKTEILEFCISWERNVSATTEVASFAPFPSLSEEHQQQLGPN